MTGSHVENIIASEHFRAPKDYADSFMVIEEKGLVSNELGQRLRQMAKFRNRIVHMYGEIDNTYVYPVRVPLAEKWGWIQNYISFFHANIMPPCEI